MNARQKLHQAKLNEWAAAFADHKTSGLTIRQWCDQNNVSFHAFNYWKHLLKEEVVSQVLPDIVEVPVPALSASPGIRHDTNSANCLNVKQFFTRWGLCAVSRFLHDPVRSFLHLPPMMSKSKEESAVLYFR